MQRTRSGRRIYVLAYISYIVFFTTLFAVIGVYVYGAVVSRSLSDLKAQLVAEQQRFSVSDIDGLKSLDERLGTAKRLLDESTAPSRLFGDIESIVASNIYFSGMEYEVLPNRQFRVDLTGRADNFNEIIGQRDLLKGSALLRDAEVVEYDYSVGEGEEASPLGATTLSFIFSDTRDLSSIPYVPSGTAASDTAVNATTENVVVGEVVSGTEAATTTAPAPVSTTTPNQ